MSQSLFGISDDLFTLYELVSDAAEAEPVEAGTDKAARQQAATAALEKWFNELVDQRDEKLDSYAALITTMKAYNDARRDEIKRLEARIAVEKNLIDNLQGRMKLFFQLHKINKPVITKRYKISLANNGGVLPLLVSPDVKPEALPEKFQVKTITINNDAVRKALDAGEEEIPWASYGNRGCSIRIK